MNRRSQLTTVFVALMVAISMVGMAGTVGANGSMDSDRTVHTMENGEDVYLVFGVDLGDQSVEEFIDDHVTDNPGEPAADQDTVSEVIQYQDVGQVNINEQGEAVAIAMDGAEATAIQEVNQQNANTQEGDASAENNAGVSQETTIEEVGDVYVVMGDENGQEYNGWGAVDDDGETTVSQTAEASVSQAQAVNQANIVQNNTALAFAENGSEATAVQMTEQSNINLQEGYASATNVYGADLEGDKDLHDEHKKYDGDSTAPSAEQDADASVEQIQEVEQVNSVQMGSAIAIAVGEDSSATAVQITDQTNLNEQLGTAEAMNVLMDSAGMHVATASANGATDVVTQDADEEYSDTELKGDEASDVGQTAEANVTQYQSVEQVNINLDSSAQAIATDGSTAEAVQLTFQQNVNAQIGSAEALNVFLEDEEIDYDEAKDQYEGAVKTSTTTAMVNGDGLADANSTTFDYDGDNEQLNDVEQYSSADVEQSQEVAQTNLQSNNALAVAEDAGDAFAFQMTMQENENVQFTSAESASVAEGAVGDDADEDEDAKDHDDDEKKTDDDEDKTDDDDKSTIEASESDADDDEQKKEDDSVPGFGVVVALVAVLAAAMFARFEH
ncbi:PGF-CTERM sorting domain-containing protein [Natronorubrum sp. DTA28]|uniref:PGF-CTERM sorting domain-containing protein n=1 Tax=Natronorubrum sp. DTA28 TaxID=3447019 RepID=UPI003F870406